MNTRSACYRVLAGLLVVAVLTSCTPPPIQPPMDLAILLAASTPPTPATSSLALLLSDIDSPDAEIRRWASYALGEFEPTEQEVVDALILASADPDAQVRIVASYALGKIDLLPDRIVSVLMERLSDEDWQVRYSTARALGNLGVVALASLPTLRQRLLSDENENVRVAAAEAIAKIGPNQNALPDLLQALKNENWFVRFYAGEALKQLGAGEIIKSLDFTVHTWDLASRVIDVLVEIGHDAIPELAPIFKNNDANENVLGLVSVAIARMAPESIPFLEETLRAANADGDLSLSDRSIMALGYSGKAATPILLAALSEVDPRLLDSVSAALTRIGPATGPDLVNVLMNGNDQAATGATTALGALGASAIPYLLPLVEDENSEIQFKAVQLLGKAGRQSSQDMMNLNTALATANAANRQSDIAALQNMGYTQDEAVRSLVTVLQNGKPTIQLAVVESLALFGSAGQLATPALVQVLRDGDEELQIAAARALGSLGSASPEVFIALEAASHAPNGSNLRKEAIKAMGGLGSVSIPSLIEATSVLTDDIDILAIQAIGQIGRSAFLALPELSFILQNGRPPARQQAAQSLGKIGSVAMPELLDALQHEQDSQVVSKIFTGLATIGPVAAPDLVQLLSNTRPELANGAVNALRGIGIPAIPALVVAMRTEDVLVRKKIVDVARRIGPHAFPVFEVALQDEDAMVQSQAVLVATEIYTFTERGSGLAVTETVPFLVASLVEGDVETRWEAAVALSLVGSIAIDAVPALIGSLQDPNEAAVRSGAARALGSIGPSASEAIPALAQALNDPSATVRQRSAEALRSIGSQAVSATFALVTSLQRETDLETRRTMIQALTVLDPSMIYGLPLVVEGLNTPQLRRTAAEALGSGNADVAPDLLAVIRPETDVAPELAEALHGVDGDIRRSAAYALLLNQSATGRVADDLVSLLNNDLVEPSVQSMIALAIRQSGRHFRDLSSNTEIEDLLDKSCPQGIDFNLSGGDSFDTYMGGCNYSLGVTAPSFPQILRALVRKLTRR